MKSIMDFMIDLKKRKYGIVGDISLAFFIAVIIVAVGMIRPAGLALIGILFVLVFFITLFIQMMRT